MNKHFVYLNWNSNSPNPSLQFSEDDLSTVEVTTSVGPYKNLYADHVLQKGELAYWEIKITKGTHFKIGIFKESEVSAFKGRAFSDDVNGFAYYSFGSLRNGSNKQGANFLEGYGPGDIIGVMFDGKKGELLFRKNGGPLTVAFTNVSFKNGGYIPVVASLMEESIFSFTLPPLED